MEFYLSTRAYVLVFIMWDYFYIFMRASDVAARGASDRTIKITTVDHHLGWGERIRGAFLLIDESF